METKWKTRWKTKWDTSWETKSRHTRRQGKWASQREREEAEWRKHRETMGRQNGGESIGR